MLYEVYSEFRLLQSKFSEIIGSCSYGVKEVSNEEGIVGGLIIGAASHDWRCELGVYSDGSPGVKPLYDSCQGNWPSRGPNVSFIPRKGVWVAEIGVDSSEAVIEPSTEWVTL